MAKRWTCGRLASSWGRSLPCSSTSAFSSTPSAHLFSSSYERDGPHSHLSPIFVARRSEWNWLTHVINWLTIGFYWVFMPVYATFNFTPYFTNLHGVFCTLFALLATARFPDHFLTRALWCATVMCGRTASFWFLFLGTGVV